MKLTISNPENAMAFNAVTSDGEVVCSGRSMRYALATSPRLAAFIVTVDGSVLAVSMGGVAWIPTRAGLDGVTAAAEALAEEHVEGDDAGAWEQHLERNDTGE